ncbi:DUF6680 family protein [Elizabethkingia ursingii]|uniref:DUF6680 family protein n=1 Tax=Elizabethkingia ursingii TaxID=1756150 RepID=UPI002012623D|nr:DUF6680 family protein [Elizabethkingia ursingii]MCL1672014.1 hypothetical protein [Elizabethkingia ursingii]
MLEILEKYGELISITLMPLIILGLGSYFQDRKAKKDAKLNLFLRLMALRKSASISVDWAYSLNQIDIVFQDNAKVRLAWRAYFDSLHEKSQHFNNQNAFHLDMLSEMADDLGYKNLRQTDIDRYYSPRIFGEDLQVQGLIASENIRVLMRSKSYGVEFSDVEYKNHLDNVQKKFPFVSNLNLD